MVMERVANSNAGSDPMLRKLRTQPGGWKMASPVDNGLPDPLQLRRPSSRKLIVSALVRFAGEVAPGARTSIMMAPAPSASSSSTRGVTAIGLVRG
jgi:hypothetical protein